MLVKLLGLVYVPLFSYTNKCTNLVLTEGVSSSSNISCELNPKKISSGATILA